MMSIHYRNSTLDPLSQLNELESLCVRDCNKISDITPLGKLPRLLHLDVQGCMLNDLDGLAKLTHLRALDLTYALKLPDSYTQDYTPLGRLRELRSLTFTPRSDLTLTGLEEALAQLTKLTHLTVPNGTLCLPFLDRLKSLEVLTLNDTGALKDLRPLARANPRTLRHLRMEDLTPPIDLSPLAGLENLESLVLLFKPNRRLDKPTPNPLCLTPLGSLKKLTQLHIETPDGISELQHIAQLPAMKSLKLAVRYLETISALRGMTGLQRLDLSRCSHLQSLAPVSTMTHLKELRLSGCLKISDLTPLRELSHLEVLDCVHTPVADLAPLASLAGLRQLRLNWSSVTDVSALSSLAQLRELSLSLCSVKDIRPLGHLHQLTHLDLCWSNSLSDNLCLWGFGTPYKRTRIRQGSPLGDVTALNDLSRLSHLNLENCSNARGIGDLSLPELRYANLPSHLTNAEFYAFTQHHPELRELHILNNVVPRHTEPWAFSLAALSRLEHLEKLVLDRVVDLQGIGALPSLTEATLDLAEPCSARPLSRLTQLRRLTIWRYPGVELPSPFVAYLPRNLYRAILNMKELSEFSSMCSHIKRGTSFTLFGGYAEDELEERWQSQMAGTDAANAGNKPRP